MVCNAPCTLLVYKTRGVFTGCKFLSKFHARKFSQKVNNAALSSQNSHNVINKDDLPLDIGQQLPVIFFKQKSKFVDLCGPVKSKSSLPFNDAQKLTTLLISDTLDATQPDLCENRKKYGDDIIESTVSSISDGATKPIQDPGLVNALLPQDLEWREQVLDKSQLLSYYAKLSKIRLTGLVVMTTVAGYAMAPAPIEFMALCGVTIGTGLTSSAANTINQFLEVPFDSQMSRTKNRVLVKGYLSCLHAITFASVSSLTGLSLLYFGVNPLTATLGAVNLFLYTLIYTPMKRYSTFNTWVGSVVGAIPPMMGWAACSGSLEPGAWLMAALLFAWQFPHFNALSWNLRPDYSRAGYRMMSVINPSLCKVTALRYTIGIEVLSLMAPLLDVTTWTFAIDSLPLNAYFIYMAWRFNRNGDSNSSRKLFLFSLIHLPALMVLMLISKKHYSKSNSDFSNIEKVKKKVKTILL